MRKIEKHKFEAVSLLTNQSGLLDVTIIPVINQPDWIVPSNLVLDVQPLADRIWNHQWQGQDISVYHLVPQNVAPEKIVVLEGNTPVHRLALQIAGEIKTTQFRISELRDSDLPDNFFSLGEDSDVDTPMLRQDDDNIGIPFVFQAVQSKDGEVFVVPDIDSIAHQLVDLDSYDIVPKDEEEELE